MKKGIIFILLSCIALVSYGQDTPYVKPVTYTNMSAQGYQFKQIKVDTTLKTQKFLAEDTSHLKGVAYASLAPQGDSSKRIATTAWSKKWIAENVSPGIAGQPTAAWSYNGNIGDTASYDGLLGMLDNYPLKVITNGVVRLIVPENGINRSAGAANKALMYDTTTKKLYYTDMASGGGSGTIYVVNQHGLIIDSLTAGVYKLAVDSTLFATQYDLEGKVNYSDSTAGLFVNQARLNNYLATKENSLGNPGTNGYVLASQTDGTRSWVAQSGGGGTTSDQTLVATAAQTAFTFTSVPASYADYIIFVNGMEVENTEYFTTSGNIVTFTTGLVADDRVRFKRIK